MVKFANRGKGKGSKRTTLKQKFKVERKVKQYRKKLKKEAKNLKNSGIRHKSNPLFYHRKSWQRCPSQYVPLQESNASIIQRLYP